jgi:hypothetical protein
MPLPEVSCCIERNKRIAWIQQARAVVFYSQVHKVFEQRPANDHGRLEPDLLLRSVHKRPSELARRRDMDRLQNLVSPSTVLLRTTAVCSEWLTFRPYGRGPNISHIAHTFESAGAFYRITSVDD